MFIYNIEGISKKMKIDFDGITSVISHNGLKGTAREELLKKYLCELLPQKYSVTGGIICDSDGHQSKQQDFIVYDSFTNASFYKFNSNSILPIESIYCTIEIKSTLTDKSLKECINNIASVRSLKRIRKTNGVCIHNNYSDIYPLGFVFAYTSKMPLKKIILKLSEYEESINPNNRISIICILDKGLILRVKNENLEQLTFDTNSTIPVFSSGDLKDSLYSFYLLLLEYLNNVIIEIPSLIKYAEKNNSFNIKPIIPPELISDNSSYKDKKTGIPYFVFKKIDAMLKKYEHMYDGKMSYEDIFNYYTKEYIEATELLSNFINMSSFNLYGYIMNKVDYKTFKENVKNYNNSEISKNYVDKKINDIYDCYKKSIKKL